MDWTSVAIAVASAIIAVGGRDLFGAVFNRRKIRVDAAQVVADTALKLNAPLLAQVDRLEQKVASLSEEASHLSDEARKTAEELHALRTAVFAPDATIDGLRNLVRHGRSTP